MQSGRGRDEYYNGKETEINTGNEGHQKDKRDCAPSDLTC
jgi:hypothetical protein